MTLSSRCKRPEQAGRPAGGRPAAGRLPPRPASPRPAAAPARQPQTRHEAGPPRRPDAEPTEVPVLVKPSSGGATIVSFDWLDRNDDHAGTSGRQIGPGGGKDEHFQLVLDLPTAAIIEEITITGGGVLRWTTKPAPRSWPVAVVANHELKNRAQMLRLGAFSGRWTFDLYAESQEAVRPDHVFGVEVVVFIRGTQHHLTARCQRK